jgi:hypothetical protein
LLSPTGFNASPTRCASHVEWNVFVSLRLVAATH